MLCLSFVVLRCQPLRRALGFRGTLRYDFCKKTVVCSLDLIAYKLVWSNYF
ncbi:acetyltransferase [Vibrio tarriae]|nr:acetyltransferase [Vibrio tarriae]